MRVSDMILLKWGDIKEDGTRIEFKMFKTKRTINFPITNELYLILFSKLPEVYQDQVYFLFDGDLRVEHQKLFDLQSQELMVDLVLENIAKHAHSVLSDIAMDEDYADKYILGMIQDGLQGKQLYSKIQQATRQYNADLKDLQNHFGIATKITTHTPRHTFSINAIVDKELDIYQLSKALNHSSVKVTESYLRGFKSKEIDESLKNFYNNKNERVEEIVEKRIRMKSFPALEDMNDEEMKELYQQIHQKIMK
jgi:integrase